MYVHAYSTFPVQPNKNRSYRGNYGCHHARRTSSNQRLVDSLAPMDGRSHNVVAGINAAHIGSPHDEVVDAWTRDGRLGAGRFWVTTIGLGGADPDEFSALRDARGVVVVQTLDGGDRYRIDAADLSATFDAVRAGQ